MIISSLSPITFTKIIVLIALKTSIAILIVSLLALIRAIVMVERLLSIVVEVISKVLMIFSALTIIDIGIQHIFVCLGGLFFTERFYSCHSWNLLFKELRSVLLLIHFCCKTIDWNRHKLYMIFSINQPSFFISLSINNKPLFVEKAVWIYIYLSII